MIGIYKITNTINGKVYIGQSWDVNKRWIQHSHYEHNLHLKAAFNKYGIINFDFEVIKELSDSPLAQLFLDAYEEKIIMEHDSTNPAKGYNHRLGGNNSRPSKETRERMSQNNAMKNNPEVRAKSSASHKGKKRLQTSIDKSSAAHLGTHPSEESKVKMGASKIGNSWNKGRKHSAEAKAKCQEEKSLKKRLQKEVQPEKKTNF